MLEGCGKAMPKSVSVGQKIILKTEGECFPNEYAMLLDMPGHLANNDQKFSGTINHGSLEGIDFRLPS